MNEQQMSELLGWYTEFDLYFLLRITGARLNLKIDLETTYYNFPDTQKGSDFEKSEFFMFFD